MQERIISKSKNGMPMLLLGLLLYIGAFVGMIACIIPLAEENGGPLEVIGLVICVLWILVGWIIFLGLKVLKPQEALVLTLFGKYKGTLKGDGFFWVNPFCTALTPLHQPSLTRAVT